MSQISVLDLYRPNPKMKTKTMWYDETSESEQLSDILLYCPVIYV